MSVFYRVILNAVLYSLFAALLGYFILQFVLDYRYLFFDGRIRAYRVHVPEALPQDAPVPLVLALHQFGDDGLRMERLTRFNAIADREGFIVCYPSGLLLSWNSSATGNTAGILFQDDERFLLALIAYLKEEYGVDPARIYMTGASNGGFMTQLMACRHPGLFAAIAPVMGSLEVGDAAVCTPNATLPVLLVHGLLDPIVPYEGGQPGGFNDPNFISAPANAAFWAEANGCTETPEFEMAPSADLSYIDTVTRYGGCNENAEVWLYTVDGGGHNWPGGAYQYPEEVTGPIRSDINASEMVWDFFQRHRRESAGSE